jgi:predicted acetyltransferase
MMRAQLEDCAARGEVFAVLHASEPVIYGRFGYGVGTLARIVRVRSAQAEIRDSVPVTGTVRLLDDDDIIPALKAAYPAIQPNRAGLMGRSDEWYVLSYKRRLADEYLRVAAHHTPAGDVDGWAAFLPADDNSGDPRANGGLRVLDFQAADQTAATELWRYLVSVDLVDEITAYHRPADEPLEELLTNSYAVRSERDDELWVRVVDVPTALGARTYGVASAVVVEVVDTVLPDNSGRYRISPQGMTPTTDAPQLTVRAEELAMIYLGTYRPSTLASIHRISITDPDALPAADRLFAVDRPAWCGTMF